MARTRDGRGAIPSLLTRKPRYLIEGYKKAHFLIFKKRPEEASAERTFSRVFSRGFISLP